MKVYKAEQIRNIALISHVGTGKTSLIDAALYDSGAVTRQGKVDEGTSVVDYDFRGNQTPHVLERQSATSRMEKS